MTGATRSQPSVENVASDVDAEFMSGSTDITTKWYVVAHVRLPSVTACEVTLPGADAEFWLAFETPNPTTLDDALSVLHETTADVWPGATPTFEITGGAEPSSGMIGLALLKK